jgi:hypothetical protein
MRFRTKVFLLFLLLAVLSSTLVVAMLYWPTRTLFFDLMQSNVLSVAATAGAMLDAEKHEQVKTRADQDTPAYRELEQQLRRARDANRRKDIDVRFIYSMRPYDKDPRIAEFVIDAEEDGVDKSNVGDIYKTDNPNYRVRFNDYQADEEFVTDQWGTWLTANAPSGTPRGTWSGRSAWTFRPPRR